MSESKAMIIGYTGKGLTSDDASMTALSGDFPEKFATILAAGVDMVLHCRGVADQMAGIASKTAPLAGKSLGGPEAALNYVRDCDRTAETEARAALARYLEAVV